MLVRVNQLRLTLWVTPKNQRASNKAFSRLGNGSALLRQRLRRNIKSAALLLIKSHSQKVATCRWCWCCCRSLCCFRCICSFRHFSFQGIFSWLDAPVTITDDRRLQPSQKTALKYCCTREVNPSQLHFCLSPTMHNKFQTNATAIVSSSVVQSRDCSSALPKENSRTLKETQHAILLAAASPICMAPLNADCYS